MQDPVLKHASWTPLARGGHSWPTHHLFINEAKSRAEFRSNVPQRKSWIISCEVIGLMLLTLQVVWNDPFPMLSNADKPGLVWLTFVLIALPIFSLTLRSVVFDLPSGQFWEQGLDWRARPTKGLEGPIQGIHAIQLLPERIVDSTSRKPFSMSYELNLVNHRGARLNIVDHGFLSWIRRDAQNLADFLNVPLWDATSDSEINLTEMKMEVMRKMIE